MWSIIKGTDSLLLQVLVRFHLIYFFPDTICLVLNSESLSWVVDLLTCLSALIYLGETLYTGIFLCLMTSLCLRPLRVHTCVSQCYDSLISGSVFL